MPINFPDSPSVNDTHTVGDKTWTWDGTSWNVVTAASGDHGNLAGLSDDDHTQYLRVDGTRSADSLTISDDLTVDTDTFHVDSTNNWVGIGTASPSYNFHVKNDSSINAAIESTIANVFVGLKGTGETAFDKVGIGTNGSNGMELHAGDEARLVINSSGNVGIGTTTPGQALDVRGRIVANYTDNAFPLSVQSGQSTSGIILADAGTTSNVVLRSKGDDFQIRTNASDRVTVDSSGNVGIGTTTPSAQLTVQAGSTGTNDGTVEFHKWLGSASSPTETEDWPTPVLALRSYDNYSTMNMLSFGYPQDAVYQTGGNVWSMRLSGVSGATSSSSSTNLQVVGPGTLDINSPVDISGAISTLGSTMLGVRQVLASHKTGYSLTGTTEIDTGLSVTITPKSTSSKILVFWSHAFYLAGACNLNSRLKRGATQLQLNYAGDWGAAGNGTVNNYYLDSPNTTSAVTYKTTMQSNNTTGVYVSNSGSSSYLLVVEIL